MTQIIRILSLDITDSYFRQGLAHLIIGKPMLSTSNSSALSFILEEDTKALNEKLRDNSQEYYFLRGWSGYKEEIIEL